MTIIKKRYNNLIQEKSPYLIQHAENPVNWNAWNEKTFEKAVKEDKPVFLSIGYSTCHWCHVMEHESFEDEEVAHMLNQNFINVKVDREERPDIDKIYMNVCQMMTGKGGWPLTIIMTPEKKPFFAATYIPKNSRYGMTGLIDLIPKVSDIWNNRRGEINESSEKIIDSLNKLNTHSEDYYIPDNIVSAAYQMFSKIYDNENGGFGNAPKFPTPQNLFFLLRYWEKTGNQHSLEMVTKTLKKMRQGGIYDHVGYGFHRYSTDKKWVLPHFEKMLYDQAMLSIAYLETYQASGDLFFRNTAEEIFSYVLREMTSHEGSFLSAEDADSEGIEGKFYLWKLKDLKKYLSKDEFEFFDEIFDLKNEGNFFEESSRKKTGDNVVHYKDDLLSLSSKLQISENEISHKLSNLLKKLHAIREKRIKPHKDDKILIDWNGLMCAALAIGSRVTGNNEYIKAAEKSIDFITKHMIKDGRLFHRYRDGEAAIAGNLDDYSFLIWGFLEMFQTTFKVEYLARAIELSETLLKYFYDKKEGAFFFTPVDGENLIFRSMDFYDGAIPSGNSVAYYNLNRLYQVTGNPEWMKYSESILSRASSSMNQYPIGFSMLLSAYLNNANNSMEVVICGEENNDELKNTMQEIYKHFNPGISIVFKKDQGENDEIVKLIPHLKDCTILNGKLTFYTCRNGRCNKPSNNLSDIILEVTDYE